MAYTISDPQSGYLALNQTDSGFVPPNNFNTGSTTAVPSLPSKAGMIVNATDPTYGGGEFILLKGVASTAVGSVVTYNLSDYTTTLIASAAVTVPMPIAVAMSANAATTTWGWYQISGVAIATKGAVVVATGNAVAVATGGLVVAAATGANVVQGAQYAAGGSTAATTVAVLINRPHLEDVLA